MKTSTPAALVPPPDRFSRPLLLGLPLLLAATTAAGQLAAPGNRLLTELDLPTVDLVSGAELGSSVATGDFDGDGIDELAVGIPGNHLGALFRAGQVVVLQAVVGSALPAAQVWDQDVAGVGDAAENDDRFGTALASGDFNGDGYDDLVISATGESLGAATTAGIVHVLYGEPGGLAAASEQTLTAALAAGIVETDANFGTALASGDFDADGFDDLAIGAPGESVAGAAEAGAVVVVYGAPGGLATASAERWTQALLGAVNGVDDSEELDFFGAALAVGDFDADGFDDLAAGAPLESTDESGEVGALNLIYGHASGLRAAGNQFIQAHPDLLGESERFASALAAGDFDGDGADDLAVGLPSFNFLVHDSGGVYIVFSEPGVGVQPATFIIRNQQHASDAVEPLDRAGSVLAVGDFDCDGFDDLVFGVAGEDIGSATDAGAIGVLAGDPARAMTTGQTWHQNRAGFQGEAQLDDSFGSALAVGDFGVGCDDLAVGVPFEDIETGAVHILRSSALFADGFESGDLSAWDNAVP